MPKVRAVTAENGADDVGLDAALLAGLWLLVQCGCNGCGTTSSPGSHMNGPAMIMRVKAALADGKIAEWNYDLWSNTHSTRPTEIGGNNLLASWYLANAQNQAPPKQYPNPPAAAIATRSRSTIFRASK